MGLQCHEGGITGAGNPEFGVAIVGIAPGRDEARRSHTPFTGPAGKLMDSILKAVGWSRDKCYTTNCHCLWNDEPSPVQMMACRPRLLAELAEAKPRLIIPLGAIATSQFLPQYKMKSVRGAPIWHAGFNCYIMPSYHPAAILHGSLKFIHDLVRDFAKIPDVLEWEPGRPTRAHVSYSVMTTKAEAQQLLDSLPKDRPVAVDIESEQGKDEEGNLDIFSDKLLCVGIGTAEHGWVIPGALCEGLTWPTDLQYTFHNGQFDVQGLNRFLGVNLPIVHDTMLQSYSLMERSGYHGLKNLAREYLGAGFYEADVHGRMGELSLVTPEHVYKYNAHDAVYTARLQSILYTKQVSDNVVEPYQKLLIPAANLFAESQHYGCKIDRDWITKLGIEWSERYLKEEVELQRMAREYGFPGDINMNSPQQLSKLLYGIIGLPGGPSTAAPVLEALRDEHPFINRMLKFRTLSKMIGTYIVGVIDDIKFDGRVHPSPLLHHTITGRTAYTKPPIQVIPRPGDDEDGLDYGRLRNMFCATSDEFVLVEADYGKAEIWAAAVYSRDENMLANLRSGDHHTVSAARVLQKALEEVTETERQRFKKLTFAVMYGEMEFALSRQLSTSVQTARQYRDGFFQMYPKFDKWQKDIRAAAIRDGELTSYTGRKLRFCMIMGDETNHLLNLAVDFPVQSLASDTTLQAAITLEPMVKPFDAHLIAMVHDSLLYEVHKSNLEEFLGTVVREMEKPQFEGTYSVPVELKVGSHWGLLKKVKTESYR